MAVFQCTNMVLTCIGACGEWHATGGHCNPSSCRPLQLLVGHKGIAPLHPAAAYSLTGGAALQYAIQRLGYEEMKQYPCVLAVGAVEVLLSQIPSLAELWWVSTLATGAAGEHRSWLGLHVPDDAWAGSSAARIRLPCQGSPAWNLPILTACLAARVQPSIPPSCWSLAAFMLETASEPSAASSHPPPTKLSTFWHRSAT